MKKITLTLLVLLCSIGAWAQSPKYIFYFIGDGMGPEQSQYEGPKGFSFTKFPVIVNVTTFSASDSITDSAAAGTALASGRKTANGTIGMNVNHTENLYSVAVDAKNSGRKVAIVTSVSIDHATPAAFYAHSTSRKNSYEIATWMPKAGFDIYAGAGMLNPGDVFAMLADSSYSVIYGADAAPKACQRTLWIQDSTANQAELAYAIERKGGELTLPTLVERSINALKSNNNGFFMMAEGGKIDWARHDNNFERMVGEVQDFSQAVAQAVKFYYQHPLQTLIIVTADHETGGLKIAENGDVSWSTKGHTNTPIKTFVMGLGAEKFASAKDNIDIANTIRTML